MKLQIRLNSISNILETSILLCLSILPFGLATLCSAVHFVNYGKYGLSSVVVLLSFLIVSFLILRACSCKLDTKSIIVILFFITICIRFSSLLFFNTKPTSDFMRAVNGAMEFATGPTESLYSARFPYWGFYRITLGFIFRLFHSTLRTAKIANVIFSGVTAVGIFLLGNKLLNSKKFGVLSAFIYICNPANILYINLTTGEHIFVMLFPFVCILFLTIFENLKDRTAIKYILSMLAGIILGLMDMYKPVAIIVLISFIITLFISEILSSHSSLDTGKHKIIVIATIIISMLLSYQVTKNICYSIVEYKSTYQPNQYGYGWTLRIGLDRELNGRVNKPIQDYMYNLYAESNENYKLVNSYLIHESLNLIKGKSLLALLDFFKDKFYYTWSSNEEFYFWATAEQVENGLINYDADRLGLFVKPLSDSYYIFSLFLSSIGTLSIIKREKSRGILTIGLFILGFTLLLSFTEVQQRYRSVLASSMPFFAAYGVITICRGVKLIEKFVNRRKSAS